VDGTRRTIRCGSSARFDPLGLDVLEVQKVLPRVNVGILSTVGSSTERHRDDARSTDDRKIGEVGIDVFCFQYRVTSHNTESRQLP
jgi:hypothetical protein